MPGTWKEKFASLRASPFWVYVNTFFITVASVLGTGILGLPVKLSRCGFYPFLVSYTVGFFMQSFVLIYVVELLQKTKLYKEVNTMHVDDEEDSAQLLTNLDDVSYLTATAENKTPKPPTQPTENTGPHGEQGINLHMTAKLFLDKYSLVIFDLSVILHLTSICITYALAGAQSYALAIGTNYIYLILPFVALLTLVIIFGTRFITPIISFMTFTKGSVLVLVVFVTSIVGNHVNRTISDDWAFIGRPFLIGTVALGGAAYVIPVTFNKLPFARGPILHFIRATIAAEFVVWLLNILWAFYILKIVPQTGTGISLAGAEESGEIATIPLVEFIRMSYPQYNWIAILINLFIMVSITVSFITMGTGLRHMLDGFAQIHTQFPFQRLQLLNDAAKQIKIKKVVYYSLGFLFIFIVAQTNPQGFIIVLEFVTSLALNLASGVFVSMMLGNSLGSQFQQMDAPLKLHSFIYKMRYVVMLYFVFAVIYDLASIVGNLVSKV